MSFEEKYYDIFKEYKPHGFNLEFIKNLKSGKEANVVLVQDQKANTNDSSINRHLYALKIYKNMDFRSFNNRAEYLSGIFIKHPSLRHAVAKGTELGKQYLESRWINSEIGLIKKLSAKTSHVPKFYASVANSILMEFIGDSKTHEPSPRLADIKLSIDAAKNVLEQIAESIIMITKLGYVHADLSQFNILIKQDRLKMESEDDIINNPKAYLIDFPQAIDIKTNKNAQIKFNHDVETIKRHFKNEYGIENPNLFEKLEQIFFYTLARG